MNQWSLTLLILAERKIYDNLITTAAIAPSTPFAMAEFLPPQVWQAISVLLKGAK